MVTNLLFLHREHGLRIGIFWGLVKANCNIKYNNVILMFLVVMPENESTRL